MSKERINMMENDGRKERQKHRKEEGNIHNKEKKTSKKGRKVK